MAHFPLNGEGNIITVYQKLALRIRQLYGRERLQHTSICATTYNLDHPCLSCHRNRCLSHQSMSTTILWGLCSNGTNTNGPIPDDTAAS